MTAVVEAFEAPNMFSLIRTPEQEKVDGWGTQPPVEDFTTGFKDASDTDLRLYTRNRIEELKNTGDESQLSPGWVAILDERSARDSTVILQLCEEKSLWATELEDAEVEYHVPGEADVYQDEIWWKWRVRFTDAVQLFVSLNDGDFRAMQWYTRPERHGPDGVYAMAV